jgi:hypothetical protein
MKPENCSSNIQLCRISSLQSYAATKNFRSLFALVFGTLIAQNKSRLDGMTEAQMVNAILVLGSLVILLGWLRAIEGQIRVSRQSRNPGSLDKYRE